MVLKMSTDVNQDAIFSFLEQSVQLDLKEKMLVSFDHELFSNDDDDEYGKR